VVFKSRHNYSSFLSSASNRSRTLLPVLLLKLLNAVTSRLSYAVFVGSKWSNALNTNSSHSLTKSSQPTNLLISTTSSLFNLLAALAPHITLPSLDHQTSSSLRITDRSFRYTSPCLWNQLPSSLRQPHFSPSVSDVPVLLTLSTHHPHRP